MTTTTNTAHVYEASVTPASGGFGMYQKGESTLVEGAENLHDWEGLAVENGNEVELAGDDHEMHGRIYDENNGTLYRIRPEGTDAWTYCMVSID